MAYCPNCGSPNVEQIDEDKYQCPYCGETFSTEPEKPTSKIINIHGYTQWFAVNPDITVTINGQQVGKVGKNGLLQIELDAPCQIKFNCNIQSANINVDPNVDTDIYLSFDRTYGTLLVNTSRDSGSNLDKPNFALNLLSFLIPLVGLILYFVKRKEYPNSAQAYLIWAIIGFGGGIGVSLAH